MTFVLGYAQLSLDISDNARFCPIMATKNDWRHFDRGGRGIGH
jgi:hypothetical protein